MTHPPGSHPTHPLDAELSTLWSRRAQLDQDGWARLYRVVMAILLPWRPPILAALHDEHEQFVHDFFTDKVLRDETLPVERFHAGALKHAYANYLTDRVRRAATEAKMFAAPPAASADEAHDGRNEPASLADCGNGDDAALLADNGLDPQQLAQSARQWLARNKPWVTIYLAFHLCPDKEHREPLVRLAQRLDIRSHHHKAAKLGINWKGSPEDGKDFGQTLIGQWITHDLGIAIAPENRDLIHLLLKILCFEALTWAETMESSK